MTGLLLVGLVLFAVLGVLAVGFVAYLVFITTRFNRRNPHARAAMNLRKRVETQMSGGQYEDGVRTYRELRDLVTTYPREPELVRFLMEAAEPLARSAADRRDLDIATELYRDAQEITHVAAMHVLRQLLRSFLPQDRGKALVCVERLAQLAERYPRERWVYWAAERKFAGRI